MKGIIRYWIRNSRIALFILSTYFVGIGINCAVFSIINKTIITELPFKDSKDLMYIKGISGDFRNAFKQPSSFLLEYEDMRTFSGISAYNVIGTNVFINNNTNIRLSAATVSIGFFELFGTTFIIGSPFNIEHHRFGQNKVVILSEKAWKSYWGADKQILGKTIEINGVRRIVVGVSSGKNSYPNVDLWIPAFSSNDLFEGGVVIFEYVGRLRQGINYNDACKELNIDTISLVSIIPLKKYYYYDNEAIINILLFLSISVLIMAFINIININIEQTMSRNHEFELRKALGATKYQIFKQLFCENISLSFLGGIIGLVSAITLINSFDVLNLFGKNLIKTHVINLNILFFFVTISITSAIITSIFPFMKIYNNGIKISRYLPVKRIIKFRMLINKGKTIVITEVILAFLLATIAILLIGSYIKVTQKYSVLKLDNTITGIINFPSSKYNNSLSRALIIKELLTQIRNTPGVLTAGGISSFQFNNIPGMILAAENQNKTNEGALYTITTSGYFSSLGIPIVAGRDFVDNDDDNSAILTRRIAKSLFGEKDLTEILGMLIEYPKDVSRTVIGVVNDDNNEGNVGRIYLQCNKIQCAQQMSIVVNSNIYLGDLISIIKRLLNDLDSSLSIDDINYLSEIVKFNTYPQKRQLILMIILCCTVFWLAITGIIGITIQALNRQKHSLCIHMAMGANAKYLICRILAETSAITVAGIIGGWWLYSKFEVLLIHVMIEIIKPDVISLIIVTLVLVIMMNLTAFFCVRKISDNNFNDFLKNG